MTIYNRVIPVLLLMGNGIYKTVRFESPKYIGDPINAVKIFNEKEVDELILIDIIATSDSRKINYDLIKTFAHHFDCLKLFLFKIKKTKKL